MVLTNINGQWRAIASLGQGSQVLILAPTAKEAMARAFKIVEAICGAEQQQGQD